MSRFIEQLSRSRTFRGQLTSKQLSQSLAELEVLDKTSEQKQLYGSLTAVAGGAAMVGAFILINGQSWMPYLGWLLGVAGLAGFVWGLISRSKAASTDFEDRRYQLLGSLHRLMSVDMAPDASVDLWLDLQPVDQKGKKVNSGRAGIWNVDYYEDSWLNLTGKLLDGSRLTLTLTEKYQYRHRKKRSASGKIKHKSKTKTGVQAVVSLKSKEEKYPVTKKLAKQVRGAVQLPRAVNVKRLSVQKGVLMLKAATKGDWTVNSASHLLSQMMLSLYQVLNLSRRIDKATQK